jgi:hypothetical protein
LSRVEFFWAGASGVDADGLVGCDVCEGAGVPVEPSSPPRRATKNSPRTATAPTIANNAGRGSWVVTA